MGVKEFFEGLSNTMDAKSGFVYFGMFVLTIIMMIMIFTWLNTKDAGNGYIIATAVLLFIPAVVFLTLWMGSLYKFSPIEKMKTKLAKLLFDGKVSMVAAFLATLTPEVAQQAVKEVGKKHGDEAEARAAALVAQLAPAAAIEAASIDGDTAPPPMPAGSYYY